MQDDFKKQPRQAKQAPERTCIHCGITYQMREDVCQRCRHVQNYVSYLNTSGSLI